VDLLTIAKEKTQLRKVAETHGGEFTGPCPVCGGLDRFHVWPDKVDSRRPERIGVYWCRSCNRSGDVVQFLVDFAGQSYAEAFRALGIEAPAVITYRSPAVPGARPTRPQLAPCTLKNDVQAPQSEIWQQKARKLVDYAAAALQETRYHLKWLKKRGISKKQAAALNLGWLAEDRWRARSLWGLDQVLKADGKEKKLWIPAGLVIPMIEGDTVRRIRIRRFSDQEPRYYVLPGSSMACMAYGLSQRAAVVVESELDGVMLAGQVGDFCGVVAMGSSAAKPSAELAGVLSKCALILVALDCDEAGAKACAWWQGQFPQAKRWPVPAAKDPGDAFAAGVSMIDWIKAGLPSAWFFGPSPIGQIQKSGGVADAECETKPDDPVAELAGLLCRHPVSIHLATDCQRVCIRENSNWARVNWETSKRISALVFTPEVFDYLWALGVEVINGKNILGDGRKQHADEPEKETEKTSAKPGRIHDRRRSGLPAVWDISRDDG
jgi:hypothetical protein